jgi:hypothetical protein
MSSGGSIALAMAKSPHDLCTHDDCGYKTGISFFDLQTLAPSIDRRAFLCKVSAGVAPRCSQRCWKAPVSPPASRQRPERPFSRAHPQTFSLPNSRRHQRFAPRCTRLIPPATVTPRLVARSSHWPRQQFPNVPLQIVVGRQARLTYFTKLLVH